MEREDELLINHGAPRPNIVSGENAKFLDGKAFEDGFDVLRIDIFSFRGDDHVFLAAEELQVAGGMEFAGIAGHEPAVDDGFAGGCGGLHGAGHDGFAAATGFALTVPAPVHTPPSPTR